MARGTNKSGWEVNQGEEGEKVTEVKRAMQCKITTQERATLSNRHEGYMKHLCGTERATFPNVFVGNIIVRYKLQL
jgi:hypothetical protein